MKMNITPSDDMMTLLDDIMNLLGDLFYSYRKVRESMKNINC